MTQSWIVTLLTFALGFVAGSIGLFMFLFHEFKRSRSVKRSGIAQVEVEGVYDSQGNEIPKGSPLYNEIVRNITTEMTGRPPEEKPKE